MEFDPQTLTSWIDRKAIDNSGSKVGSIADVYLDDATGEPEWLAVLTGWFGSHISFVPLIKAKEVGDEIDLGYAKDLVKDAPRVSADGALSVEEEAKLYAHYGLAYEPRLSSSELGMEELQQTGSTTVSAEVTPAVALARLRRRDDQMVDELGFDRDDPVPGS